MIRWLLLVPLLAALGAGGAGCDFEKARTACLESGRCLEGGGPDGGAPDAGELDGGEGTDGGDGDAGPGDGGDPGDAGEDADAGDAGPPDAGPPPCTGPLAPPVPVCREAWCWQHPLPQGNPLTSVHGADGEVFISGHHGTVLRVVGCAVQSLPSPPADAGAGADHLRAIHAVGFDDVVVGSDRGVSRWSGDAWGPGPTANSVTAIGVDGQGQRFYGAATGLVWNSTGMPTLLPGGGRVDRLRPGPDGLLALAHSGLSELTTTWTTLLSTPPPPTDRRGLWVSEAGERIVAMENGKLLIAEGGGSTSVLAEAMLFPRRDMRVGAYADLTAIDGLPGKLWIGTEDGRVFQLANDQTTVVATTDAPVRIEDVHVAAGRVWAVAGDGSLYSRELSDDGPMQRYTQRLIDPGIDFVSVAGNATQAWAVAGRSVYSNVTGTWSLHATLDPVAYPDVVLTSIVLTDLTDGNELLVGGTGFLGKVSGGAIDPSTIIPHSSGSMTTVQIGASTWNVRSLGYKPGEKPTAAGRRDASSGVWWEYQAGANTWVQRNDASNSPGYAYVVKVGGGWTWGVNPTAGVSIALGGNVTSASTSGSPQVSSAWAEDELEIFLATNQGPVRCAHSGGTVDCAYLELEGENPPSGNYTLVTRVGGQVVFLGAVFPGAEPPYAAALKYDPVEQVLEPHPAPPWAFLRSVWGLPGGGAWAVGDDATVLRLAP